MSLDCRMVIPLLVAALCGAPASAAALSEVVSLDRANRGTVRFTHRRHAYELEVECSRCHHNIARIPSGATTCKGCHADQQHSGLCHQCHLSNRDTGYEEDLARVRRELGRDDIPNRFKAFHNLCRNCHHEVNESQNRQAPYECGGCHK
ncbi:MAG: cytochrome c3 family protein [Deferrisomatales bacterium]|nr:cytochrome c3 family protein [Deferrisomatales bacterium]